MLHCSMTHRSPTDDTVCSVLKECRRIAIVGLSEKPWRDSNRIGRYLLDHGYEVLPVNPSAPEILGRTSYPDLAAVPRPVDLVSVFRRREHIPELVDQAIRSGAKNLWMQSGLTDDASAARARSAGLRVIMDACIMVEHIRHFGGPPA